MQQDMNSVLQFKRSTDFHGLGETNMLANAYLTKPQIIEPVMAQMMGHQGINIFEYLTGGMGAVREVDSNEYEWDIYTKDEEISNVLVKSPDYINDASQPGINGTFFRIILDRDWYGENDILVADDAITRIRLTDDGVKDGEAVIYTAVVHGGGFDGFCPVEFLDTDAQWSKDYTLVGEGSMRGNSDVYHTPYGMKNILGIYRKTIGCTRSASDAVMVMELPNPNDPTKTTKLWTNHQELVAIQNWHAEMDKVLMYSTYNKNPEGHVLDKDNNGRPAYEGAGVRQQIAKSNISYYTGELTYARIDDYFTMLSYKIKEWGGNAEFIMLTGKQGIRAFHNAISKESDDRNIVKNDASFLKFNGDNITLSGYYTSVVLQNGIKVTVKEFPPYDDTQRFRKKHPVTGYPVESYRYTILNMGSKDMKSNIRKVVMKNGKNLMWHVEGSQSPTSGIATGGTSRATGYDGYETHWLSEFGVQIQDPTTCGELILRVD